MIREEGEMEFYGLIDKNMEIKAEKAFLIDLMSKIFFNERKENC